MEVVQRYRTYLNNERKRERQRIQKAADATTRTNMPEPEQGKNDIILTAKTPEYQPQEIIVSWNDIRFYDNVIRIGTPIVNKPIVIKKKNCRVSYNKIKELMAEKLPKIIIISAREGGYKLKDEIDLSRALNILSNRAAAELIDGSRKHRELSFNKAYDIAERDQEMILKRLRERKQKYINYLISLHCKLAYKVVPAIEVLAHLSSESTIDEDAFIFTIPCSRPGCVKVVYENVNEARASIVFLVQTERYPSCLQSIFNYMGNSHIMNKREQLRLRPNISAPGVLSIHSINHTEDMHDWVIRL